MLFVITPLNWYKEKYLYSLRQITVWYNDNPSDLNTKLPVYLHLTFFFINRGTSCKQGLASQLEDIYKRDDKSGLQKEIICGYQKGLEIQ